MERIITITLMYPYTSHIIMTANEKPTILVTKKIREKLKTLGKKGEPYNDIIIRLIEEITRQEFIAQQY